MQYPHQEICNGADLFLKHNFSRIPAAWGKLVGQISRSDVLGAIQDSANYYMDTEKNNDYFIQENKGSLSKWSQLSTSQ